jgi:hypothetical protein
VVDDSLGEDAALVEHDALAEDAALVEDDALSRLSFGDQKTLYSVPTTEGGDLPPIPSDAAIDPEGSPDA